MTNCLQYELVFRLEELVGEAEHLYIFYPQFEWMEDSFCHMTVITDSRWVNQLVGEDSVPRFRFYNDSDLMGEDRNDVLDFDGNNDEQIALLPCSTSNVIFVFCSGLQRRIRKEKRMNVRVSWIKGQKKGKSEGRKSPAMTCGMSVLFSAPSGPT